MQRTSSSWNSPVPARLAGSVVALLLACGGDTSARDAGSAGAGHDLLDASPERTDAAASTASSGQAAQQDAAVGDGASSDPRPLDGALRIERDGAASETA